MLRISYRLLRVFWGSGSGECPGEYSGDNPQEGSFSSFLKMLYVSFLSISQLLSTFFGFAVLNA